MQQEINNEATIINEAANDENMLNAVIAGAEQMLELPKLPVLNTQVLEQLEDERKQWEFGVYRKSNLALYAILAKCLAHAQPVEDKTAAKKRMSVLDAFCKSRNYVVGNDTPLATKVVRAVFGNVDRRRVSTYSLVVRAALDEKVNANDMVQWIDAKGGIEEIRLGGGKELLSDNDKIEKVKQYFETEPALGPVHSDLLNANGWNSELIGKYCLLVAECEAEGTYLVHEIVTADAAIKAAMLSVFAAKKKAGVINDEKPVSTEQANALAA